MLKKVKNKFNDLKDERKKRVKERALIARERAEERERKERERVQIEKDLLMALSDKELMVEGILALRGYNARLNNIEEQNDDLKNKVDFLKLSVNSLDSNISRMGFSVDELKNKDY